MSKRSSRAPASRSGGPSAITEKRASSTRRGMGVPGSVPGTRRQKARKSCSPSRASAPLRMAREVQGARHLPRQGCEEGIGPGRLEHEVAVMTGRGRAPGVEAGGGHLRRSQHHGRAEHGVHRPHQALRVGVGIDVDVHHLPGGVHPGVGAPRAHELDGVAGDHADRPGQLPTHGPLPGLGGEAPEPRPVVGDGQAEAGGDGGDRPAGGRGHVGPRLRAVPGGGGEIGVEQRQTSSMRAMGALSPSRGPSFRMRV